MIFSFWSWESARNKKKKKSSKCSEEIEDGDLLTFSFLRENDGLAPKTTISSAFFFPALRWRTSLKKIEKKRKKKQLGECFSFWVRCDLAPVLAPYMYAGRKLMCVGQCCFFPRARRRRGPCAGTIAIYALFFFFLRLPSSYSAFAFVGRPPKGRRKWRTYQLGEAASASRHAFSPSSPFSLFSRAGDGRASWLLLHGGKRKKREVQESCTENHYWIKLFHKGIYYTYITHNAFYSNTHSNLICPLNKFLL